MNIQKYRNHIMIALFVVSITAPLAAMIFNFDQSAVVRENREQAKFPAIKFEKAVLKKFPHDFYTYFRDNFGFRASFIRLNFLIRRPLLHEAEFNTVLFGKEGWLYYLGEKELDGARGITIFDEPSLRRWTASLELKRTWLAARGIRYLFVIAPSKGAIYEEYLPSSFSKISSVTDIDEFIDYVEAHSGVEIIDLRPALIKAKSYERLFMKTDTHWNEYGAFIAYQEIIKALSRHIPSKTPDPISDFTIEKKMEQGGDLAVLAGGGEILQEEQIILVPKKARQARRVEISTADARSYAMQQDDKRLPRALVFRDSFFDDVIPFISEHFQYALYYRHHWDDSIPIIDIVKETRPDIVIDETAERQIKFDLGNFTRPN